MRARVAGAGHPEALEMLDALCALDGSDDSLWWGPHDKGGDCLFTPGRAADTWLRLRTAQGLREGPVLLAKLPHLLVIAQYALFKTEPWPFAKNTVFNNFDACRGQVRKTH
jgi:hypothetical protein